MTGLFSHVRIVLAAFAVLMVAGFAVPAVAQQPGLSNPSASAVNEEQLLQKLQRIQGRVTIPDAKASTLEQPAGREWREFHTVGLPWIGGVLIIGMIVLLALFYMFRGTIRIEGGRSGRTIQRFNGFERFAHWLTATSFIILAITGLNISFGRGLLLPVIGPDAFAAWSQWGKYAHNYLAFAFILGVVLLFLLWIKDNFPTAADLQWLKEGGGMVGHKHPPAWKFNAGQKLLFWFVVLASIAVAVTGLLLMMPFYYTNIAGMQVVMVVHGVIAMLFIALIIAHIYIGTLGMEGGFDAMGDGQVDMNWAKQHHPLWVEKGSAAKQVGGAAPSATPAE